MLEKTSFSAAHVGNSGGSREPAHPVGGGLDPAVRRIDGRGQVLSDRLERGQHPQPGRIEIVFCGQRVLRPATGKKRAAGIAGEPAAGVLPPLQALQGPVGRPAEPRLVSQTASRPRTELFAALKCGDLSPLFERLDAIGPFVSAEWPGGSPAACEGRKRRQAAALQRRPATSSRISPAAGRSPRRQRASARSRSRSSESEVGSPTASARQKSSSRLPAKEEKSVSGQRRPASSRGMR